MKTRAVWMMASVALFCVISHADEKAKEAAVKPETVQPDIVKPAAASDYVPFVVPLPKDESGFATKPPEGGTILVAPDLRRDGLVVVPPQILQKLPPPKKTFYKWWFTELPLSNVLSRLEQAHRIEIVACFSPEKLAENPKITMTLRGRTASESLDGLKVLGLVWRNIGDTYYVAWSENDLPPLQNAITPAPQ